MYFINKNKTYASFILIHPSYTFKPMLFKKIFTVLTIIILVVSCKKKAVETDNLFKFRDYISYTTSGLVSVADPIEISLAKEVAGREMGKELTENLLT
ncbi:MAG TPA: hypothetical protein PKC63_09985, partial [Mariniflexile sp.]|nr:hypothetical protein [Mariniflexile sp.]